MMIDVELLPLYLSPCGRGRLRQQPGEGGNTALYQSSAALRCACRRGAATLTRPFGATSPIEGEVKCALPPLHLSPGGRGRARSARMRGETPCSPTTGNPA